MCIQRKKLSVPFPVARGAAGIGLSALHPTLCNGFLLFRRHQGRCSMSMQSSMSFPPLLGHSKWRNPTVAPTFPGASATWRKSLAARPLSHQPSAATVGELRLAMGGNFPLLHETTKLKATSGSSFVGHPTGARPAAKPKLYASVWGAESTVPTFSVWAYCQKHGHAPPSVPQPPIRDMKGWFAEYGRPRIDCPPGFRSEFAARTNIVRKPGATDVTQTVRMLPGRVLR